MKKGSAQNNPPRPGKLAGASKLAHIGARIPADRDEVQLDIDGCTVKLTHLQKVFWPEEGLTKGDLLRYYADVSPWLLPHLQERAMVMKRYPNGIDGKFFFMKRAPAYRPDWIDICSIEHGSGSVIDFAVVRDLPSLLWVVNLGCVDLNPWYARCNDLDRPDFLHFDLDPVPGTPFASVRETALRVRAGLEALGMRSFVKTTGSRGVHLYVPIVRNLLQKEVWSFAKQFALGMERVLPELVTAEYRVAKRPSGRVLLDYNQNAWGRTLASVYSVRPRPRATVSTPVTWGEMEKGVEIDDFTLADVPERLREKGDLWSALLDPEDRVDLSAAAISLGRKGGR